MTSEVVTHPYDWNVSSDPGTGNTVIHCWSLDRDSNPYLIRFPNFEVFCYVELPMVLNSSFVNWSGFRKSIIYDAICNKLGDDRPHKYMLVQREKIYFYKGNNKKYPMLLLCFNSVGSMLTCKNKLKYPFKVKGLKGGNDMTMVSLKVWETHIPVERKLLTLRKMKYSQWFKVQGRLVTGDEKISTLEREYIANWRTIDPIPTEETTSWITHPKIFSFDLETYSDRHDAMPDSLSSKHVIYLVSVVFQKFLEPQTREKRIILLGDCSDTDLADVTKVKNEMELLDKLQDWIVEYDPEIITGYNIFGYDNPYMEDRLKRKLRDWRPLGRLLDVPSVMKSTSWSSSAYKNQDFTVLEMAGRISIDMLPVIRRDYKLRMYNLNHVAKYFLKKGKHEVTAKEMFAACEQQVALWENYDPTTANIPPRFLNKYRKKEFPEEEIRKLWIKEHKQFALDEMKRVVDYCVVDSDLVIDLFEKINVWIGLIQMSNIVAVKPADIFTRGTGIRMISQVYDEASQSGVVMDEVDMPDTHIEGGFVYDPTPGIYHNIPCFDFKSLYPNIQISENMDHTTLVPPDRMDLVPDEECNVIEWDEEESDDEDSDDETQSPKKKKKRIIHHKYKFVKKPEGIMPRLLRRLIAARNAVRKKQKNYDKNSLEWNVLEQTQLSIKISCNSYYGACSSAFSKLSLKIIGKCITAKARESTKKMNAYLESKGYKIVYGDSVTGDTPVLIRKNGVEKYIAIENLVEKSEWDSDESHDKQYVVPENVKVWSDLGYTKVFHVMRHRCQKRIFCVVTRSGIVKVTEDHSLLLSNGKEITPKQVQIGDVLMTRDHPVGMGLVENKSVINLVCGNALNAAKAIKNYDKNYVVYRYDKGNYYMTISDCKVENPGEIVNIINLGVIDDWVYDLETENHHFAAGVGQLVVHNTDSTMPDLGITDPAEANKIGAQLAEELTAMFPKPMAVEHEMTYHTMLSIKKKFYICIILGDDNEPMDDFNEWKVRGVLLSRRDNCPYQKTFYRSVADRVLHRNDFWETFNHIIEECIAFMSRAVKIEDLVMIKGLGSHYKSKSYMMNIFAQEMEKSGNPLVAGDRISYLLVDTGDPKEKVGYKMRTLELFNERSRSSNPEHIDYIYYLEKSIRNGIEKQLFQIGYKDELEKLKTAYSENDSEKFIQALGEAVCSKDGFQELKSKGYQKEVDRLRRECSNSLEIAQALLASEQYAKLAKPLYNFYVKRRLGRGKRLSTRVDGEPILMMVRLFRQKALVMEELRERRNGDIQKSQTTSKEFKVKKKAVLKVIKPTEWIKQKGEEMRSKCK